MRIQRYQSRSWHHDGILVVPFGMQGGVNVSHGVNPYTPSLLALASDRGEYPHWGSNMHNMGL